jgi:hypothetical protein
MNSIIDTLAQAPRPARETPFSSSEAEVQRLGRGGVALRLLVAAVAILLVVAAQLSTGEFDSGWRVVGIAFCVVVVAALALSVRTLGPLRDKVTAAWRRMARRRASARADQRFMARARHDPRLMAEIQVAITRQQSPAPGRPKAAAAPLGGSDHTK